MNPGDKVQIYAPALPNLHGRTGTLEFIADAQIAYVNIDGHAYPIHPADIQPAEEPS